MKGGSNGAVVSSGSTATVGRLAPVGSAVGGLLEATGGSSSSSSVGRRQSTNSLKNSWKLKYQDFVPAKTGSRWKDSEQFHKLVDRANEWLRKNDDVRVRTCETITWMSHDQRWLGDSDQMILSKTIAEGTTNYFLRGLRVWLVPASGTSGSTTIRCTDVVPEAKEAIADLVDKVNRKMKTRQIRGQILSVETVGVPVASRTRGHQATTVTRWEESIESDHPYSFVLRVFTDVDASTRIHGCDGVLFGLQDVVPAPTEYGYESFEELIEKSNNWLKDQSDVIITNMQSLMVQRNEDVPGPLGSACFYTMHGTSSPDPIEFFRILRISHLKLTGDRLAADLPIVYPFAYETFTPELVRLPSVRDRTTTARLPTPSPPPPLPLPPPPKERLEKMKETFSKVVAFLRNAGVDVICSETVMNPMQMYIEDTDTPPGAQNEDDNIRFLFTIRLFLTGQIGQLLDCSSRMIKRASFQPGPPFVPPPTAGAATETSDLLLPSSDKQLDEDSAARAPLFLGSVVGRQFKYRWLVLGVSAVTCMTIIVALSVVYSNK